MLGHFAFAGRVPPDEIQLWDAGSNPTDYGNHLWTDRSAAEVLARYVERGNPLLLDIDHNVGKQIASGQPPPAKPAVTAGYAHFELRAGLPFLRFEWSDEGRRQVASGERRFLSPEYDTDERTGEIVRLYRVSLVGDPGTHHARVLASAGEVATMISPEMRAALNACLSADDPKKSIKALLSEVDKASAGAESPAENDASAKPPPEAGVGAPAPVAAAAEEPKKEPVAAAAEEPKKEPVTAESATPSAVAASAAPPPVVPRLPPKVVANASPAPVTPDPAVAGAVAASSGAVAAVDDLRRDILVKDAGDRLTGPIRQWASSQPLAVVKQYLDALPAPLDAPAQVVALRGGAPTGGAPVRRHLTGAAADEYKRAMGHVEMPPIGVSRTPEGYLQISAGCPGEYRAQEAARAAGKR